MPSEVIHDMHRLAAACKNIRELYLQTVKATSLTTIAPKTKRTSQKLQKLQEWAILHIQSAAPAIQHAQPAASQEWA